MYEELSFEPEPFEDFQVFDELRSESIPANRQQQRTQEMSMHDQLSFEAEPLSMFRGRREEEVIPPVDTRTCIRPTTAAPFRYICSIQTPINPTTMRVGSGTLIGPRTVLTAGHNMDGVSAALTQVAPGRNGPSGTPFGISAAALFVFQPVSLPRLQRIMGSSSCGIHSGIRQSLALQSVQWPRRFGKHIVLQASALGRPREPGQSVRIPRGSTGRNALGRPARPCFVSG